MAFSQVVEKYNISRNDLLRYFQVRDFIWIKTTLLTDCTTSLIEKQMFIASGTVSISAFYATLQSYSSVSTEGLRITWEKELGVKIKKDL